MQRGKGLSAYVFTYDLMLSRRGSIMKFSRVISRVRWFSLVETNVSKTISVLVLRVTEIIWVRWTTQSFYLYLSNLRSQGRLLATWGFNVRSLLSLPGSAFWLASILVIGNQVRLWLKPFSLLKLSLFSLMWMASFTIRYMYPVFCPEWWCY
jgi:hypothetical protein